MAQIKKIQTGGAIMKKNEFSRREFIQIAGGSAVFMMSGTGCALLSQSKEKTMPRSHYKIFSKGKIGDIQLKNRLIKSATGIGATNEDCTYMKEGFEIYKNWSKGGGRSYHFRSYDCSAPIKK